MTSLAHGSVAVRLKNRATSSRLPGVHEALDAILEPNC
jgi:hypothetical protein